jgi:hypothetical protein
LTYSEFDTLNGKSLLFLLSLPTSDHPVTLTDIPSKQPTRQRRIVSILRPLFLASKVLTHFQVSKVDVPYALAPIGATATISSMATL